MNKAALIAQIFQKKSFLCVGLDTDIEKIPSHLKSFEDPVFEFNRLIVEATKDFAVAYKPNIAFYEAQGEQGWKSLRKTLEIIPKESFTIADAKRGDIGNTSSLYARTFFQTYDFDAVTVAPYMGEDSVKPFLTFKDKWVIVLGLTSNAGSEDFQQLELKNGEHLYEHVLKKVSTWGKTDELMFVVGATQAEHLKKIRNIVPEHFLLVPGVGAQGGSLAEVAQFGITKNVGLLVNASRSILYASSGLDFAQQARNEAQKMQEEMAFLMEKYL